MVVVGSGGNVRTQRATARKSPLSPLLHADLPAWEHLDQSDKVKQVFSENVSGFLLCGLA